MRMFLINNFKFKKTLKFKIYNKCPLHIYKDMNTLLKIRNALKKKLQGGGSH